MTTESLSEDQWKTLQLFLRQLYAVGEDILYLSKPMDSVKRDAAKDIVAKLQKDVKAADGSARNNNIKEVRSFCMMRG